ncbi:unnamed protein product [Ambrosiozyma monospora]|uniref:Unnamed protein product n=1 Tax=Ambrosiozyma monospora TaxID=43982 RepID=A0ACB5UDN9_AMBMO|nr:unnamed protein product [Ambrosiozyma monospora]
MPISISSLLLNYAVLANKYKLLDLLNVINLKFDAIANAVIQSNDEESAYRLLIAYGTLNYFRKQNNTSLVQTISTTYTSDRFTKVLKEF